MVWLQLAGAAVVGVLTRAGVIPGTLGVVVAAGLAGWAAQALFERLMGKPKPSALEDGAARAKEVGEAARIAAKAQADAALNRRQQ